MPTPLSSLRRCLLLSSRPLGKSALSLLTGCLPSHLSGVLPPSHVPGWMQSRCRPCSPLTPTPCSHLPPTHTAARRRPGLARLQVGRRQRGGTLPGPHEAQRLGYLRRLTGAVMAWSRGFSGRVLGGRRAGGILGPAAHDGSQGGGVPGPGAGWEGMMVGRAWGWGPEA